MRSKFLPASLFLLLPSLFAPWPRTAWLQFVLHIFLISGFGALALQRWLKERFTLATFATNQVFTFALFSTIFGMTRWFGLDFGPAYFCSAIFGQFFSVLGFARFATEKPNDGGPLSPKEAFFLTALTCATFFFFLSPFTSLGSDQGDSLGFSYLMITDIFGHMGATGEIAKGIPPTNPYFSGVVMHYYWLAHVIPATFYQAIGKNISLFPIIQMTCCIYALVSLLLLASVLRNALSRNSQAWIPCMVMCIFAYSYIWILPFGVWVLGLLSSFFPQLPIQKILQEQGETYSGLSHGSLRDFLIEPHGVLGFSLLLALFLWKNLSVRSLSPVKAFFEGFLIGSAFGIETFYGLLIGSWWGLLMLLEAWEQKDIKSFLVRGFSTAVGILIPILFVKNVGMIGEGKGNLEVVPYLRMMLASPVLFLLEFGPIWIFAILGCRKLFSQESLRTRKEFIALFVSVFLLMFFLRHSYIHNLIFRKYLRAAKLPLLLSAGFFWENVSERTQRGPWKKRAIILCLLLAVPSTYVDHFNLSQSDGEGRSILVDKADARAYLWLKSNSPEQAVIQGRPDYGNKSNFTPAVLFSDRRAASGDFIHARNYQIGDEIAGARAIGIRETLFGPASVEDSLKMIQDLGITHIFVGPVERSYYGDGTKKFAEHPEIFQKIYDAEERQIYQVKIP